MTGTGTSQSLAGGPPPRSDVHDAPDELSPLAPLRQFQERSNELLWPLYDRDDRRAIASQRDYRRLAFFGAIFASAALLAAGALAADVLAEGRPYLERLEWGGVVCAVLVVLAGILSGSQEDWLVSRYRAERYRLLKFLLLARPSLWARGESTRWNDELEAGCAEIRKIEFSGLEREAKTETLPDWADLAAAAEVPEETRRAILHYYRERRMESQIGYFEGMSERSGSPLLRNRRLIAAVFLLSLSFVLAHYIWERQAHRAETAEQHVAAGGGTGAEDGVPDWGKVFALASLAIPALWAGVRTWRNTNEFARNRSRAEANLTALEQIRRRLRDDVAPEPLFANLRLCEYVLAADQDEWLRLMLEAEWFG